MAFDARLLGENEQVILDLRPHWSQIGYPVLAFLTVLVVGIPVAVTDRSRTWQYIMIACLVAGLAQMIFKYLRWRATNFVLTSDRLIYRTGVAAKRGLEIPLDRIGTIGFEQSFFERIVRRGDLAVEALGDGGVQVFENVPRPKHVQRDINATIEQHQHALLIQQAQAVAGHPPPGFGSEPAPAASPYSIPQQIDQLDQLRRRGVITEYEFDEKKRELLNRM